MIRLAVVLALVAGVAVAQAVENAPGAKLRVLDRLSGSVEDIVLQEGQSRTIGRLTVQLDQCRYHPDNPAAEAYAHLTIADDKAATLAFSGWMVASSPGLSALDHPRYDVWVLRCDVPDLVLPEVEPAAEDPATDDGNG